MIHVPSLWISYIPHLMIDSCLYCKTFKKLFPDGITGNHYFFLMSTNAQHFPSNGKHLYCTKLKVSSEWKKISLSHQFCSTAFPIESHKQHVGTSGIKTNLELVSKGKDPVSNYILLLIHQHCTWNKITEVCSGRGVCAHECVWCTCVNL